MRRTLLVPAALLLTVVVGCTPTPEATPSTAPAASEAASPSTPPSPEAEPITLPDCAGIYSPDLAASLTAEGRTSSGDISAPGMGGWGTFDAEIEAILASVAERVSCTWILPASESASTTSIARLDDATRTTLIAAFTAAGFTASATPDGDLYSLTVTEEFITYTEAHLLTTEWWIGSVYGFGQAEALTLDAAAQLLP